MTKKNRYDITGKRMDMVVAIRRTATKFEGSAIWLFQCDCGNQVEVASSSMNRRKFKSCGCRTGLNQPSPKRSKLVGEKFGRLKVIEFAGVNKHQKTLWRCQCDCGNETTVVASALKNNNTISCGCFGKERRTKSGRRNLNDLTGMKFGRLTVRSRSLNKGKSVCWLCECECGNTTTVRGQDLTYRNGTKSCGCISKEFIGEGHPNWKGGKRKNISGYITLSGYKDHPNSNAHGVIAEHRLLMSESLARPLRKNENVHHINGIRDDNQIKNLELWVKRQPPGQRVKDRISDSIDFLNTYAPNLLNQEQVKNWKGDHI